MTAVIASELRKYLTTATWWILLIVVLCGAALYAGIYGLTVGLTAPGTDAFVSVSAVSSVYNGGNTLTRILVLVLGVMAMGAEYRHKTIGWTYLATPVRARVVAAKAVVVLGMGLAYGVVSVLAGVGVAIPLVGYFGGAMMLDDPEVWRALVMGAVSLSFWALMGMGIGILIKNMLVAMVIAIGFAYLIEPVVAVVFAFQDWPIPLNLMPSGATSAFMGLVDNPLMMAPSEPFPWWAAGLVLLGWAAVPTAVGIATTIRRDIE